MRLPYLFLRTRQAGRAAILLAIAAVAAALWRHWSSGDSSSAAMLLIVPPLAAAAIIAVGTRSPMHDLEATANHGLPLLRLGHIAGLLALAALGLAIVSGPSHWMLVRNAAGFTGLALLTARVLGSSLSWVPPLCYGALLAVGATLGPYVMWPMNAASDRAAAAIATTLLLAGLALVAWFGARDRVGEVA